MTATAVRLLGSSARNSYDPDVDIDWDAPVEDDLAFMPLERVSIYGTPLWHSLTEEQQVELSRHEMASIASTGLWFEMMLIQMLVRHAARRDPQGDDVHYAITEIGDETRHILMFARAIRRMGVPTYSRPEIINALARFYAAVARGPSLFAPVLVAEETLDRLQREAMNDETIQPLIRMINRIHVVEEARHVSFARGEVAEQLRDMNPLEKAFHQLATALVAAAVVTVMINPSVYKSVGIRPRDGLKAALGNPHYHDTRRFMGAKVMGFLQEQGMIPWFTKPIYKLVHLI